jgi:hypothetical protein
VAKMMEEIKKIITPLPMVLFVIAYLVARITYSGMTSPMNQVLMRGRENKKGVDKEEEHYE